MATVQFDSRDVEACQHDFSVLGITAEIIHSAATKRGKVVAYYEPGRQACKLREYLESHHITTRKGHIALLPIEGWTNLVDAAVLH